MNTRTSNLISNAQHDCYLDYENKHIYFWIDVWGTNILSQLNDDLDTIKNINPMFNVEIVMSRSAVKSLIDSPTYGADHVNWLKKTIKEKNIYLYLTDGRPENDVINKSDLMQLTLEGIDSLVNEQKIEKKLDDFFKTLEKEHRVKKIRLPKGFNIDKRILDRTKFCNLAFNGMPLELHNAYYSVNTDHDAIKMSYYFDLRKTPALNVATIKYLEGRGVIFDKNDETYKRIMNIAILGQLGSK